MGCNYLLLPLISTAGTSNCIPQILWDAITCACRWYLLLTHKLMRPPFCTMTSLSDIRFEFLFKAKMSKFSNAFQSTYSLLSEYPNIIQSFHIRSIIECGILCWENPLVGISPTMTKEPQTTVYCWIGRIYLTDIHIRVPAHRLKLYMCLLESTKALDLCIVAILWARIRDMDGVMSPTDSMFLLTPVALFANLD